MQKDFLKKPKTGKEQVCLFSGEQRARKYKEKCTTSVTSRFNPSPELGTYAFNR